VNVHWYFVNDYNRAVIAAATARDMGVFIISPTDKGGMLHQPPGKLRELCTPLTPIQFNDIYCLADARVHTLSVGAARPTDFDEHVAALAHYDNAAAVIAPIEARLRAEIARVHGEEWAACWSDGLPNYGQIPGGVNVQEIVRLWHFAKALDLVEWGKMRYNLMGNAGLACGASPFAERIPAILVEAHGLLHGAQQKRLSESE
jgi:predicted aldo/keto reductase-like oxidoreductase